MTHRCHALLCRNACPPKHLMCPGCWAMVSPETQREVYRTVKLRDMSGCDHTWAPWWRAAHTAMAEVARKTPERFEVGWSVDRWLAKEMAFASKLEADR